MIDNPPWSSGQWTVGEMDRVDDARIRQETYACIKIRAGRHVIALATAPWYADEGETTRADAHLIAAAPDLSDSAQKLADELEYLMSATIGAFANDGTETAWGDAHAIGAALDAVNAALAKARGEGSS